VPENAKGIISSPPSRKSLYEPYGASQGYLDGKAARQLKIVIS